VFNRRAANPGSEAKAERIALADDKTVKFVELANVFDDEHCANNFKLFAGLQTFQTPIAAIALRVYPNGY
jgi:hypothetical protein